MANRTGAFLRRHIFGLIAIFIALGGTAYALQVNSVKSKHVVNGQIKSADVADGAVTGPKLGSDAVTSPNVAANTLTGDDIDESSLQVEGDGGFTQAIVRSANASDIVEGQNYRYANPRCEPGETATGSGWKNGSGVAFHNYPTAGDPIAPGVGNSVFPGGTADGWFVMLQGIGTFTAYVICEA